MPTIIDSLVVTLGLDPKDLGNKAPAATKQLKNLETQGEKTSLSVDGITKSLTGFLALLGGTVALKNFVTDFIDSNAQLERFSRNIGLSVPTVSAWGNAVEAMGGSARDAQGTLDMLSKAQTELMLTGQSSLIPYFSSLGIAFADVNGKARPVDQILLDIASRFEGMDRTTANNFGRMMGIDQNTLNLLLQGRKEVELTIQRQKDYTASTKAQAEEAAKLQKGIISLKQQFTALGRGLFMEAAPAIERVLQLLTRFADWASQNREFISDFLKVIAVGIGAIALAALPLDGVVAGVLALSAAIALLWQDYQTWKRGGDSLIPWDKWEPEIKAAIAGIKTLGAVVKNELGPIAKLAEAGGKLLTGDVTGAKKAYWDIGKMHDPIVEQFTNGQGGQKAASAASIQKYFQSQGWSAAQAAGIAANLISESGGRTNATGDSGHAYGLAQWHPDRQAAFSKFTGHDIKSSTLAEQLAFVQYELTQGSRKSAGDALRGATTASAAGAIVSRRYEVPKDADGEASRRGSLATQIAGIKGAATPLSAASTGGSTSAPANIDKSVQIPIGAVTINTQATDADGIARDFSRSMDYLFTSQANAGLN